MKKSFKDIFKGRFQDIKNRDIVFIIFLIIVVLFILVPIILFYVDSLQNLPVYNYLISIVMMIITFSYFLATKRIANKTAESVEATKKLIDATLKPREVKRKSIAKNLLLEVHENNNLIKKIESDINEISRTKTRLDPLTKPEFLSIIYNSFNNSVAIDFIDEDLSPLIRTYYNRLMESKESISIYNLNSGNPYELNYLLIDAAVKIKSIYILGEILFDKLETESGFKYSEKNYYYEYKPFDFQKYLDGLKDNK